MKRKESSRLQAEQYFKKWSLLPRQVAYVGDSAYDMQAAKEVGVIALGAAWAETSSYERLDEMAPVATFRTVESFINWIRSHVEGYREKEGLDAGVA